MSARRRVVLSATSDPVYGFFAPLSARVWRRVTGLEPLLLLVGGEEVWRADRRARLALEEAERLAEVVFVPPVAAAPHTVAQVARLLAAALDGAPDDYLVVGDVDLWPLAAAPFADPEAGAAFQVLNADAYGGGERFPMCHLGGRRAAWREIFALDGGLDAALARVPWPADGDWHFDERWATARLRAWSGFSGRCRLLARAGRRLDRADWRFDGALDGLADAHLLRPGFADEHWPRLLTLLAALLPADELREASAYGARYRDDGLARTIHEPRSPDRRCAAHPCVARRSLAASQLPPRSFVCLRLDAHARSAHESSGLERWFRLWFEEVARLAPEPYRSYGGYGDGQPNGTACSLEAVRAFARLVEDPGALVLNAGAGASSFLLRRLFRRVVCVDGDPAYLELVRRICVAHGLDGDGFLVGLENAPDADYTFFDYGEITAAARMGHHDMAYRKTRRAIYYDDADDRPHAFPHYRRLILDFAAAQGVAAEDCRAARDRYGRWGVVLRKPPPPAAPGLIAFSLWGGDPLYLRGAVHNLAAAAAAYPGYRVRIYTDDPGALDTAARAVAGCEAAEVAARAGVPLEVVPTAPAAGIRGMCWRFLAASDQQADPILFRDCDSRLNPREAAAVSAWLRGGRKFHVMHDHPDHAGWPMLGGMWGVRGGVVTDMERRVAAWDAWAAKPDDMRFLAERVWPEARRDLTHHASVATPFGPAVPFPPHPPWRGFVGEIVRGDA